MNERDLAVLEQYELSVSETYRGRGSYVCVTEKGKKLLQEYRGSERKARLQQTLLMRLSESGYPNVDIPVTNAEGNVVTKDKEGNRFILKDWMDGRECDVCRGDELRSSAANLARLHNLMRIETPKSYAELSPKRKAAAPTPDSHGDFLSNSHTELLPERKVAAPTPDSRGELSPDSHTDLSPGQAADSFWRTAARHNKELKKVRSFIRNKKNKTEFELCFLQYFTMFYEKGVCVQEALARPEYEALQSRAEAEGQYRHGEYSHHNVLFTAKGIATVNFEHYMKDIQIGDLIHFLRKIMEKYDWDETLGCGLLEAYDHVRPLTATELCYLAYRLAYPEKFWKLTNRYYNVNKAWISGRNTAKLVRLVAQETKKEYFVRKLLERRG